MNKHKVGIIGFGVMAGHHVTQLSKGNVNAEAYAVFDISEERKAEAKRRGLIVYDSAEALLNDKNIDIVAVATPNDLHEKYAVMAMRQHKNVIVEKPVTLNAESFIRMTDEAEKAGVVFTADQNRRTNKDYVTVKKVIESGDIGKPYLIESSVSGCRGTFGWRRLKENGGGMLYDWGVHLIDQILCLSERKVTNVFCNAFSVHYPEIDDCFYLTLEFDDGLVARINVSTNAYISRPRWFMECDKGTVLIDDWTGNGKMTRLANGVHTGIDEQTETKAGPTRTMLPRDDGSAETVTLSPPEGLVDNLDPVYEQFINAIDGKAELTITPAQLLRSMKVIDAAFLSAQSGCNIKTFI